MKLIWFVVSGEQLYNRINYSLENINHPVFSGHMQVRQLFLYVLPRITVTWAESARQMFFECLQTSLLKPEQPQNLCDINVHSLKLLLHWVGDSISLVCRTPGALTKLKWMLKWEEGGWLQKWDPSAYYIRWRCDHHADRHSPAVLRLKGRRIR